MAKVQREGLCPMTPPGIEQATFWLEALCLNQLHHLVPSHVCEILMKFELNL
jgi:hypothetical protein